MYNQAYEDYMINVLGYMPSNRDMEYTYRNDYRMDNMQAYPDTVNVESMYPEIYKIVYPMVKKACTNYRGEITEENVERITMEIFTNVEVNMETETQITVQNRNADAKVNSKTEEDRTIQENRNNNFLLKDLIRILVLRELIAENRTSRPRFEGVHPQFSGEISPFPRGMSKFQHGMYAIENFY